MTTIQPRLVRADTLDLQSHNAPSAQDHSRAANFNAYNHGAGAHHREALRNAEQTAYNDQMSSPRRSIEESHNGLGGQTHMYDSADDDGDEDHHNEQNAGHHPNGDYENGELDDEEDLDDDLMDKISSSPSIEDGKYFPFPSCEATPASSRVPMRGPSPFSSLSPASQVYDPHHTQEMDIEQTGHRQAEYPRPQPQPHSDDDDNNDASSNASSSPRRLLLQSRSNVRYDHDLSESCSQDSLGSITKYLLPIDDPLLDNAFDDLDLEVTHPAGFDSDDDDMNWVDEEIWYDDESSVDGDTKSFQFTTDPRYLDSGWGGECLRETEDIDFEFVYALHTFVATVEGQANATKGDTMVLLDDSNSYWWLVRVVKDGSIGYLPAEHIETPTERLARLNKHRNIDLAASMLGDNPEKSKNPLKKAMRRRNAKSVAFAAPTYYEPSDYAYSSDEDEENEDMDQDIADQHQHVEDGTAAEVLIADGTRDGVAANTVRVADTDDRAANEPMSPVKTEAPDLDSHVQSDDNFQRTRNGVVRNTDSFFKDDTVETKKISLTPRLLRGDGDAQAPAAQHQTMSTETFDKLLGDDRGKDDKKKKEKKGMLSGLFKRKDKKGAKVDTDDLQSMDEPLASPTSKDSMDSASTTHSAPERKLSKLQKTPPTFSPKTSPTENKTFSQTSSMVSSPSTVSQTVSPRDSVARASLDQQVQSNNAAFSTPADTNDQAGYRGPPQAEKRSIFTPITTVLKPTPNPVMTEPPSKPVYAKKAKERFVIDSADSDEDSATTHMQNSHPPRHSISPMLAAEFEKPRPESTITVSPIDSNDGLHENPFEAGGHTQVLSNDEALTPTETQGHSDTASTSKPSPSLATHTPSTSRSTPTWSDASLRTYMESDQDIRDLLIIVHDKSNVTPVGPDHPLMGGLFMSERTRLAEMQSQLDSMLTSWISRKNPNLLAK